MPLASLLIAALAPAALSLDCPARLEAGRSAYGVYDVARAEALFQAVESDCPKEAPEAVTELARIAWLVDGQAKPAAARLRATLPGAPDPCPTARLLGRILNADGRAAETPAALAGYAGRCAGVEPAVSLEVVQAHILQAAASRPAARATRLMAARRAWAAAPDLARASLQGATQRLAIGLLARDPEAALDGWRSFFWLEGTTKPQAFGESDMQVRTTFVRGLAADATDADAAALATLLVRAGFAAEAERLAQDRKGRADQRWRRVEAYLRLRRDLQAQLLAHDRAYARRPGGADEQLEPQLQQRLREAVAEAGGPAAADPWPALRELWGLSGTTGRSNGVSGLHLGHVSIDMQEEVSQQGRRGAVAYAALDNMIANGFSGWLGDGQFSPGGWAADGRIIQVRPRYVQTALEYAAIAVPGPARDRYVARMRTREAGDDATARETPVAFLPGLADRMRLQAIDAIAAEVRARGVDPADFTRRFTRLWYDRTFEGSIRLHEGRHILDQASYAGPQALANDEMEYRAKLSELSLSTSPRVALTSIYGRLLGGTSGHGIANARLLGDFVAWMETHPDEVEGFARSAPILPQLDRLTDEQLRRIARSLEPERRGFSSLDERGTSCPQSTGGNTQLRPAGSLSQVMDRTSADGARQRRGPKADLRRP